MTPCRSRATLLRVDVFEHIAAIAIVFGSALVYAAMAWANQHQS
jgi:hypothetical protein